MPAQIHINSPQSGMLTLWVEKPYLKFGPEPDCDLEVGGNTEARGSIRFKEGKYWLFNDSSVAITIAGQPVAQGKTQVWDSHQSVRFPDGTEYQLRVEGDPNPTRRPAESSIPIPSDQSVHAATGNDPSAVPVSTVPSKTGKGFSSTELAQLAVTLLCVSLLIAFMVIGARQKNSPNEAGADELSSLVELGLSDPKSERNSALVRRLQMAEGACRHGNMTMGVDQFRQLKSYLDEQSSSPLWPDNPAAFEVRLRTFVSSRLAEAVGPEGEGA
jgi:hypothetical protein